MSTTSDSNKRRPLILRLLIALLAIGAIVGVWRYLDTPPGHSRNSPSLVR